MQSTIPASIGDCCSEAISVYESRRGLDMHPLFVMIPDGKSYDGQPTGWTFYMSEKWVSNSNKVDGSPIPCFEGPRDQAPPEYNGEFLLDKELMEMWGVKYS